MSILTDEERRTAESLAKLACCNPFSPERIEYEREILGDDFAGTETSWHKHPEEEPGERPNVVRLSERASALAKAMRERLSGQDEADEAELKLYEDVALYVLYDKYNPLLYGYIQACERVERQGGSRHEKPSVAEMYDAFQEDVVFYFGLPGLTFSMSEADHLFAGFFQVRRAFNHIFHNIIGGSMAAAKLRAAVWESIFTCDMHRYRRAMYDHMGDITTLITGPSGTGKELVARAIALSRYIPFDPKLKEFETDYLECFLPLNLSALSPTLIESELFGHVKGAFTGAVAERKGYLETCPAVGTVFLDEVGDLDPAIQVKLLRVLQTRVFQRIGDTSDRHFSGKIVAATNRDIGKEMAGGRFRDDLYYRLCSDVVVTPSLREQIADSPEQLHNLLLFLSARIAGHEEADALTAEVERYIDAHLGMDYPWPGNVRELEQCVRNILVRREYQPACRSGATVRQRFLAQIGDGALTADELLGFYCTLIYAQAGSYQEAAARLGLDRRTVKSRVDEDLLEQLS